MNDQSHNDLDQARETVDALAQHVDTAAAWNAVEGAVDRLPRDRARRRLQLATAVVAVVVLVAGIAFASRSGDGTEKVVVTNRSSTGTLADCDLPALQAPSPAESQSTPVLGGPAVASLKGGAALAPFELDGGKLSVTPPLPGDKPSVTATQAECAALASSSANGWLLSELAHSYGGAAVGYGRVTVDPKLIAASKTAPSVSGQNNQDTHPSLPDAAQYQDRLAWLVVVREVEFFNGLRSGGPNLRTTTSTAPASASNGYVVFLVDAKTGSNALLYAEAQSSPAAVTVPVERVSVPWTLVSRSPDGYSGTIRATVLPCDGYPNPVNVDRDGAAAAVIVQRPVDPSCGEPVQVTIPLHAATVTSNLPAEIAHDELGPVVTIPSSTATKSPDETGGVLRMVSDPDNGQSIEVSVGSVLAVGPLHVTPGQYAADLAKSSDPAVLGTLDGWSDYELGEFRAWRAGHADLFVDGKCPSPGCKVPLWVVHVTVK